MSKLKKIVWQFVVFSVFSLEKWCKNEDACAIIFVIYEKAEDDFKFASKVRRGEKWFLCADSDQTDRSRSNLTWRKTSLIDHSRQKGSIREEWKSKKVWTKDCWHFHRFFFFCTMNYSGDICFKNLHSVWK